MNVQQVRIWLEAPRPVGPSLDLEPFLPLFHRWIQDDRISALVPIDVVDYRHLRDRPRVLLIAHHGHLCVERLGDGRVRLSFARKRDAIGDATERIAEALREVARAALRLGEVQALSQRLPFSRDRLGVAVHSRLVADRSAGSVAALSEAAATVVRSATGAPPARVVLDDAERAPLSLILELQAALDLDALALDGSPELVHG